MTLTQKLTAPLAIYIHWPFCLSKCPYCDFNSHVRDKVEQDRWRAALLAELRHSAASVPGRQLRSIFFGGGTPSLMEPMTAAALIDEAKKLFPHDDTLEITLEANPTSVEAAQLKDFRGAGVNRVSLGVQALHDDALQFLGRHHSAKEALAAVELAGSVFPRHSFDLIYARPGQTVDAWRAELTQAFPYTNGHLSLYQLTIEENTAFHTAYAKGGFVLPDEDTAAAMYEVTQESCEAQNMPAYEISNHASTGEESRHNLAYWKGHEYLGVGPGAHGRIDKDGKRVATVTLKSPERWLAQVERIGHGLESETSLSQRELIEERVLMGLRIREGISLPGFEMQTGSRLQDTVNAQKYSQLIGQGFLEQTPDYLRATSQGRLLLTKITQELLA